MMLSGLVSLHHAGWGFMPHQPSLKATFGSYCPYSASTTSQALWM